MSLSAKTTSQIRSLPRTHSNLPFPLVDHYSQPGYLSFNANTPTQARWVPIDQQIGVPPDWIDLLQKADNRPTIHDAFKSWNDAIPFFAAEDRHPKALDAIPAKDRGHVQRKALASVQHLVNSSILVVGDSVDRNFLDQFGWIFQAEHARVAYNSQAIDDHCVDAWSSPHVAEIKGAVNLKITNVFHYGFMDEADTFSVQPDWRAPGKFEDRVDKLFVPYVDTFEHPLRLIQVQASMWDLAFYGHQDKKAGTDTHVPFTEERINQWCTRMRASIRKLKKAFPGVPIVFRLAHRAGENSQAHGFFGVSTNFFTDVRFHQLREMQRAMATAEGLAILDFGRLFEGYQGFQNTIHPFLYPGGTIMAQSLLHQAYLAKYQPNYNRAPENRD